MIATELLWKLVVTFHTQIDLVLMRPFNYLVHYVTTYFCVKLVDLLRSKTLALFWEQRSICHLHLTLVPRRSITWLGILNYLLRRIFILDDHPWALTFNQYFGSIHVSWCIIDVLNLLHCLRKHAIPTRRHHHHLVLWVHIRTPPLDVSVQIDLAIVFGC